MNENHLISFQIFHKDEQLFEFQPSLILFFGLHGTTQILCGSEEWQLEPAGLLSLNPFELFQVRRTENATALALHIPQELLRLAGWEDGAQCRCYAYGRQISSASLDEVRYLYAAIFQHFFQNREQNASRIASTTIKLAGLLLTRFSIPEQAADQREQPMQRLKRILNTIHTHWNEEVSLAEIAQQEFLSVGYLSRLFKNNLHTTFTQYVITLRLRHAAQMLAKSGDSVTQIAYSCGFHSGSAFIEYFRKRYGQTPGQYRAAQHSLQRKSAVAQPDDDVSENLSVLLAYARPEEKASQPACEALHITVRCREPGTPLRDTWRRLCNIGYAHDGLLADVRQQLERAQREIGFEYLRFHGIFDDDMKVYMEYPDGTPYYNFTYVNLLFDYLHALGLKVYLELSFLPPQLAQEQNRIFDRCTVISACADLEKWSALIRALLLHFVERYGRNTIRQWRFTTVSMNYAFLGCMDIADYFALYRASYNAVKSVDTKFLFGGPGAFANLVWEPNGYRNFLAFAQQNGCMPDFFAVQYFPHRAAGRDPAFMDFTSSQQSAPTVLSSDENFMRTVRKQLQSLFEEFGADKQELWFEECNSTLWQRDLSGDTCYKAVWLAKNLCENYDCAESFGYWLLTDLMDEHTALDSVFHGGYGLFTYNGIPKSGYQAMRFLRQLGDTQIGAGDGWFLTRHGKDFQLLLYHYCHYDNLYRYRYKRLSSPQEAYSVFQLDTVRQLRLTLDGIPDGVYRLETRTIGRGSGSAFDKWLETGAPAYLRPEEIRYLVETAQPSYHVREVTATGGLRLEETLYPLETRLILLHQLEE